MLAALSFAVVLLWLVDLPLALDRPHALARSLVNIEVITLYTLLALYLAGLLLLDPPIQVRSL